jgi:hypothetical protein
LLETPGWLAAAQAAARTAANVAHLQGIADAVNPQQGTQNCGFIIDAVIARETGSDPNAVAPAPPPPNQRDGTWDQIEARHHTNLTWGSSFQAAYDAVQNGGAGTIAIVGMASSDGQAAHVVALVNHNGTVGIVEGQGTPQVITDAASATNRYPWAGNVGWGVVGSNP